MIMVYQPMVLQWKHSFLMLMTSHMGDELESVVVLLAVASICGCPKLEGFNEVEIKKQ
jgi:hypothetical protein